MHLAAAEPERTRGAGADLVCRCAKLARGGAIASVLLLAAQPTLAQSLTQSMGESFAPPAVQLSHPDQRQVVAQRVPGGQQALRAKVNQETLVVAASRPGTSHMAMARELSDAVGPGGGLRVLPIAGDGGVASLQDLLFLRGIDLAIVPANILAHARTTNAFGGELPQRLAYVTALYSEGVHVIVGREVAAASDLASKKVAIPAGDGAALFTANDVFRRLGVTVESVAMDPADALDGLRAGKIAAVLLVGGKPLSEVSALPKDGSFRLLSLPFQALPGEGYVPAVFLPEDYPALIPPGAIVESVAVAAVLMANKGSDDGGRRIAKHAPALLVAVGTLAASQRDARWKDVNIGAVLPGWTRVEAAERWLSEAAAQRRQQQKGASEPPRTEKPIKSSELSPPRERNKKLFDEFEAWARQSAAAQPAPE